MSVVDENKVDGMAYDKKNKCLRMLIADHIDWEPETEYAHLEILQDKINAYVSFIETRQYEKVYPKANVKYAVFEIHSLFEPTEQAIKFLNTVQDQLGPLGIKIECHLK